MAVIVKNIIPRKQLEDTQSGQYTAPATAVIDKFTVTNTSASVVSFSVNLVAQSGTPGVSNLVLNDRQLSPKETYTCPELVGQVLAPGGFISTIASAANALTISASGREIT